MKYLLGSVVVCACLFWSCAGGNKLVNTKKIYGLWEVDYFELEQGRVSGADMGNARYEFTEDGYRIKTLNTLPAPPPDSIGYALNKQEISYPSNPKLPIVTIMKLDEDSLILKNDKVEWHLYRNKEE